MSFKRSAIVLAISVAFSSVANAFIDTDSDGMPDGWEDAHTLIVSIDDSAEDLLDTDGLTNIQEYLAGTNPLDPDTDKDGVLDGSDPWPTNSRYRADTDNDGLPDFYEYLNSSIFRTSPPYLDENTAADAAYDDDSDGLTNLQEFLAGTDFAVSDTDGDGIDDGADIAPLNPAWYSDTDSDGMPDEWEGDNGLNVGVDDSAANADTDGLTNLQEYQAGTDPQSDDTDLDGTNDDVDIAPLDPVNSADLDEDGMPDGWESANSLNDADSLDASVDSDSDGLSNLYEYLVGTARTNPDTDNDGTFDGADIWPLDPTRGLDDDRDGLPDNWETARGLSAAVA
ncbi:MAG: hypothetical protein KDI30_07740, partial [Pseudomonadales bacterium]|nr:hypothetical protein [Pseudomonadales bacterium]